LSAQVLPAGDGHFTKTRITDHWNRSLAEFKWRDLFLESV